MPIIAQTGMKTNANDGLKIRCFYVTIRPLMGCSKRDSKL